MSRFQIFISYRRNDTRGYAGWLEDCLERHYGPDSVFLDVGDIGAGMDFPKVIEQTIRQSDVVLCLIGNEWAASRGDGSELPRIQDPDDWVRKEVAAAIKQKRALIPILIDDAVMPSPSQLPEELRELSRRNALRMTLGSWQSDVKRLIEYLEQMRSTRDSRKLSGQEILGRARSGNNPPSWVGRSNGLSGKMFKEDVETGRWQTFTYEVQFGGMPRSKNWFSTRDFVGAIEAKTLKRAPGSQVGKQGSEKTAHKILSGDGPIADLYGKLRDNVKLFGEDINEYPSKLYIGFKSRRTFLSVVPQKSQLKLYLNLPAPPNDPDRLSRDVTNVGHWGIGNYEVVLSDESQLSSVLDLARQAYEKHHR